MHKLHELKEKLIEEMEAYSENGKYSKEDVEAIKYLSSAVDHICNIIDRCEEEEYSGNMMPMGGMSYRDDRSYARGRGRSARRDSMGRYSREGGYSRAENDFRAELQELMHEAPNDHIRQKMQSIMSEM